MRAVENVRDTWQTSRAELAEDLRVKAAFDEAVKALAEPVKVRRVPRPGRRK